MKVRIQMLSFVIIGQNLPHARKGKKIDKERDTVSSDGGANDLLINVPSNDCMTLLVLLDLHKKSLKIPKLVIKSCKSYNVSK